MISSLDFDLPDPDYTGPGEVPNTTRKFTGQVAPAGLDGNHHCGTEKDFEEGGEYLPDVPPAPYDALGYLACCAVPDPPPPATPIALSFDCQLSNNAYPGPEWEGEFPFNFALPGWVAVPMPDGVPHRFSWEPVTPGEYTVDVYWGFCFALSFLVSCNSPGVCYNLVKPPGGSVLYFVFNNVDPGTHPFRVRFRTEVGTCP